MRPLAKEEDRRQTAVHKEQKHEGRNTAHEPTCACLELDVPRRHMHDLAVLHLEHEHRLAALVAPTPIVALAITAKQTQTETANTKHARLENAVQYCLTHSGQLRLD